MGKIVNFGLAILAIFMFVTTVAVSTGNDASFNFRVSEAEAAPPESCFVKTIRACPPLPGGVTSSHVTCDRVNAFITNDVCRPVRCMGGEGDPNDTQKCDGTIPAIGEIGD